MRVQFAKWGNSVALRVPAAALRDFGASEGTVADLTIDNGRLVLTPIASRTRIPLSEYVSRITKDNLHVDQFPEPAVGAEGW